MSRPLLDANHSCLDGVRCPLADDLGLYGVNCDGREELERFIAAKYLQVHKAELGEYLPLLLGIRDKGSLASVSGFRPGLYRPMFLEQYLDIPIEQQVSNLAKRPVDRCSLVEIGNFAVTRRGYGPLAMTMMAAILSEAGYEWMIFTATEQVERLISRLGFRPQYLAGADADRLVGDKSRWGSYYENNPSVMVGHIETAIEVIAQNPRLAEMVDVHQKDIKQVASSLRDYRRLRVE